MFNLMFKAGFISMVILPLKSLFGDAIAVYLPGELLGMGDLFLVTPHLSPDPTG